MSDGAKELPSTVSLLRVADNSITANKLEDIFTMQQVVNELGLFSFLPNISTIVIHEGQHPKEELILEDKVINRLARKLVLAYIVVSSFKP